MSKENDKDIVKFVSSRFGDLEVPQSSLITIPSGIIGFPELKRYVLLEYTEPFSWLQCVDDPDLAFVVVSGAEFGENYTKSIPFPKNDTDLDLKDDDEFAIVNLVSVRPNPTDTTVNLKAPLVVNLRNRCASQLVLDIADISTRHPLWGGDTEEGSEDGEANKDESKSK